MNLWGCVCMYHLNNIFTLQSAPFPFSFHLRSGPQRCDVWTAALLGSHFSSCAVSQTAKLDDLAIQRAENSCMNPSNHLDKPSLKRPGNVTLIQTHSFRFPPPQAALTSSRTPKLFGFHSALFTSCTLIWQKRPDK